MDKPIIKPGKFSLDVAADGLRDYFDTMNEVLIGRKTPIDLLFFGDSITQAWELAAYYPGKTVVNRGIGGDRTLYALKRFEADVLQLHPKHCISLIGINDAWDLEPDLWHDLAGKPRADVLADALHNITAMADAAQTAGQSLVLCSALPTDMKFTFAEPERKRYVVELNEGIRTLCQQRGLPFVDYFSLFVAEDGRTVQEGLTIEGLHPNLKGYDLMADLLHQTLQPYGIDI